MRGVAVKNQIAVAYLRDDGRWFPEWEGEHSDIDCREVSYWIKGPDKERTGERGQFIVRGG